LTNIFFVLTSARKLSFMTTLLSPVQCVTLQLKFCDTTHTTLALSVFPFEFIHFILPENNPPPSHDANKIELFCNAHNHTQSVVSVKYTVVPTKK
jgi:hypothetical protein